MTRQKLLQLDWGVLVHLLYPPDIVPLGFHLFLSSENSVHGGLVTKSCLTLGTPWAVAYQAPLPMAFPRQADWSGLPFSSPGDSHLGILWTGVPTLQAASCTAGEFFTAVNSLEDCKRA